MEAILAAEPNLKMLGKTQLRKRLRGRVTPKEIEDYFKSQDTRQIETPAVKRSRKEMYVIPAHPGTYMIDVIKFGFARQNGGKDSALLMVDVPSRKAFAKPLVSLDDATTVKTMLELIESIGPDKVTSIQGDNQFGSKMFTDTCEALKIKLWTNVARDDHISGGNVLGILDNVTKTLKGQFKRWQELHDSVKWTQFLSDGLSTYNSTPSGGLQDRTPDVVFVDSPISMLQRENIQVQHNQEVFKKSKKFSIGQKVRILEEKQLLSKGKDRWSREVYTVVREDGFKLKVQNEAGVEQARRFKSNELLAVAASAQSLPAPARAASAAKQQRTVRKVVQEEGIVPHEPTVAAIGRAPKPRTRSTVDAAREKLRPQKAASAPVVAPKPAAKPKGRKLFKDLSLSVGAFLIMNASGESTKQTLMLTPGQYVHAGWVASRDAKDLQMRWLLGSRAKQGLATRLTVAKATEGVPLGNWAEILLFKSASAVPLADAGAKVSLPASVLDKVKK